MISTHVELPGLGLKNPVTPINGTFGLGDASAARKPNLNGLGTVVIKTTIPRIITGNPQPQIAVLDTEILDSVGLTNPRIDAVIKDKLAPLRQSYSTLPIMVSVGEEDEAGYVEVAQKLSDPDSVSALEINVSCPNVNQDGMSFGAHPDIVEFLVEKIKAVTNVPIYVKLTPSVTDIIQIAKAAEKGGANELSLINTLLGMDIDIRTRKPALGHNADGLSGEAAKSAAPRMVRQVHQSTSPPITGMGGISLVQDVIKLILAGTSAVAVETVHFKGNIVSKHIADEPSDELEKLGIENINDLVNRAEFN